MERIISGIQPTGNIHLGNYLGSIKNWLELQKQKDKELYIFVADLHGLTGNMSAEERREQLYVAVAELLACGIDPKKTVFWVQSHVPACTELSWIFSCISPLAEVQRMTQYKDKKQSQEQNVNVGLLTYPILQAADILLFKGTHVPVGKDQIQHIELSRDTAKWFNARYGVSYFAPVNHLLTNVPKVMSLLEPDKKMSKSKGEGHVISLADEPEIIEKKLKKAVTASDGEKDSPGVKNLLGLLKEFAEPEVHARFALMQKEGTIRYGDLKVALADAISYTFADFRKKRAMYLKDKKSLDKILEQGRKKAQKVADETLSDVRKIVGLR